MGVGIMGIQISQVALEEKRKTDITDKANTHVINSYSELKQRKMLSIATSLQDKQIQGLALSVDEEILLQSVRDANTWISSVRDVENTAISDGALADDVTF